MSPSASPTEPVGTFCLVLHSHLPWLARHGAWPVGEEWLYQAWAGSYLPVIDLLRRLGEQGQRDVLTLGVTPVLAAQLDDPYCLRGMHDWLGSWLLRAHGLATEVATHTRRDGPALARLAAAEHQRATAALADFEANWRHGGSAVLRPLVDAGVVELLGGPATHPFQPLLGPRVREFALRAGLDDTARRLGSRPAGIWAPECGYAPGMEHGYASAGVQRFLVDGPAMRGDTAFARTVGDTDVVCFGRDLPVTYRVWSPKSGYPGHKDYRDFHTFHHGSGLKPSRVTGRAIPPERKKPYDPEPASEAVRRHAADFVTVVRSRLAKLAAQHGRPALVVAAYDTELFGHWWFEGPEWLATVLRELPRAGVRVTTLRGALDAGLLGGPVELPASSWGSGKDWRVWDGALVADLLDLSRNVQRRLVSAVDSPHGGGAARDRVLDGLARQALLALSSDWAFMVSKSSAADYARSRAAHHAEHVVEITDRLSAGRRDEAAEVVADCDARDTVFGQLDARLLRRADDRSTCCVPTGR
ncbi:1,4-alpha-glucan branching protein domain-containing protein [Pseudonocardia acaciae]|uniref:1,4-alpha-glucan branching protein domain-containing protein n=1 Tax=Pseudonocardia acaciae TaxID=551276 RepID=UPI0004905E04|nr:glycoside hydrolase family 57 protein [Pseudonocardia acaciae]